MPKILPLVSGPLTRRDFLELSVRASAGAGLLLALPGCSSNPGTTSTPGISGELISNEARAAALNAVNDQFAALPHSSITDDNQRMLAFLQGNGAFVAAGTQGPGSVWARFTDGTPFIFVNDGSVTAADIPRAHALAPTLAARARLMPPTELPAGKKVFLFNNIGNTTLVDPHAATNAVLNILATSSIYQIAAELLDVGFNVVNPAGTPDTFKLARDADLVYMFTHLGGFLLPDGSVAVGIGTALAVLTTGNIVDLANFAALQPDIKAGYVGYMAYADFLNTGLTVPATKSYYFCTGSFFAAYMTLTDESMVFINGCASDAPTIAPTLMPAFHTANAGVYVGWDNLVNGGEVLDSGQFLLEGMAGVSGLYQVTPPLRPFAYPEIATLMHATKRAGRPYGFDQSLDAAIAHMTITALTGGTQLGLLAPSIATLQPGGDTLTISGIFGETPGSVAVSGVALTVVDWNAARIIATLPAADKPGGAGEVVVTVKGLRSNPVRLTAWQMTFQYSATYNAGSASNQAETLTGSYSLSATLSVWIRADIHRGRNLPGDVPPLPPTAGNPVPSLDGASFPSTNAKLTAYSISGVITHTVHTGDIYNPVDKTVIESTTVDGSAPYPYDASNSYIPHTQGVLSVLGHVPVRNPPVYGAIDVAAGTMLVFIRAVMPTYQTTLSDTTLGAAPFSAVLSARGLGPGGDGTVLLTFDQAGNIAAGSGTPGPSGESLTWSGTSPVGGSGPNPNAAS